MNGGIKAQFLLLVGCWLRYDSCSDLSAFLHLLPPLLDKALILAVFTASCVWVLSKDDRICYVYWTSSVQYQVLCTCADDWGGELRSNQPRLLRHIEDSSLTGKAQ